MVKLRGRNGNFCTVTTQSPASLEGVEVRPSRLSGVRKIFDVILSYTNRQTNVTEKYFVRVDATEDFLFPVTALSPYYER